MVMALCAYAAYLQSPRSQPFSEYALLLHEHRGQVGHPLLEDQREQGMSPKATSITPEACCTLPPASGVVPALGVNDRQLDWTSSLTLDEA